MAPYADWPEPTKITQRWRYRARADQRADSTRHIILAGRRPSAHASPAYPGLPLGFGIPITTSVGQGGCSEHGLRAVVVWGVPVERALGDQLLRRRWQHIGPARCIARPPGRTAGSSWSQAGQW
jgi:hypothetical protein